MERSGRAGQTNGLSLIKGGSREVSWELREPWAQVFARRSAGDEWTLHWSGAELSWGWIQWIWGDCLCLRSVQMWLRARQKKRKANVGRGVLLVCVRYKSSGCRTAALSPLVHRDSSHMCGCVFEWISCYGLTDTNWRCVCMCVHQLLTLNVLERSEKEDD